jgi:hypothetical protein
MHKHCSHGGSSADEGEGVRDLEQEASMTRQRSQGQLHKKSAVICSFYSLYQAPGL